MLLSEATTPSSLRILGRRFLPRLRRARKWLSRSSSARSRRPSSVRMTTGGVEAVIAVMTRVAEGMATDRLAGPARTSSRALLLSSVVLPTLHSPTVRPWLRPHRRRHRSRSQLYSRSPSRPIMHLPLGPASRHGASSTPLRRPPPPRLPVMVSPSSRRRHLLPSRSRPHRLPPLNRLRLLLRRRSSPPHRPSSLPLPRRKPRSSNSSSNSSSRASPSPAW
mmetsp:Transcript_20427/g.78323  ORF Transcript_20427/g.78323 Transcript_20427/m.78323 type:complete len:221 (-) Transcript_20427:1166-1828(-)